MDSGSVGTFEREMLPHLAAALTLARYLLGNAADADDAVQDAYLQAIRHFAGYRGENARAWLLTIVRRVCYALSDRNRRHGAHEDHSDEIEAIPAQTEDPESGMLRGELQEVLTRAVNSLPDPFREVIVLREIQDLSYREISEVTGVPVGTVMSRLARARRRLQQVLEAQGMEG